MNLSLAINCIPKKRNFNFHLIHTKNEKIRIYNIY